MPTEHLRCQRRFVPPPLHLPTGGGARGLPNPSDPTGVRLRNLQVGVGGSSNLNSNTRPRGRRAPRGTNNNHPPHIGPNPARSARARAQNQGGHQLLKKLGCGTYSSMLRVPHGHPGDLQCPQPAHGAVGGLGQPNNTTPASRGGI